MTSGMFDYWYKNGRLTYDNGDVKIFTVDREEYLFVGATLYASSTELPWYTRNVYGNAKGKCLEIGLGLGVASKAILANPSVNHLLTVEKNPFVISAFGRPLPKHNILEKDVNEWINSISIAAEIVEPMYDFIFVDHYTFDDEEYKELRDLQQVLKSLLKKEGTMVFWIDENAPEEDQFLIRSLWV